MIRLAAFSELDRNQLAGVIGIYEEAFPPPLRVELADLGESPVGARVALALLDESAAQVGFCAYLLLAETGIAFLRYFAVDATLRSRGLGQAMWTLLKCQLAESGSGRVVFEVEHPAEVPAHSAEWEARQRRIAFYQRVGAVVLPVAHYRMPDLLGTGSSPEPMLLLGAGTGTRRWPVPDQPGTGLREVVLAIYEHRYGLGARDPLVVEATSGLL